MNAESRSDVRNGAVFGCDAMADVVQRTDRVIVVPGEQVGDSELKSGNGTYRKGDLIFSAQLGIVNFRAGFVNVIPFAGKYSPKPGDSIIGIVQDAGPNSWMVDIGCPYPAFLHANESPWKVDFGATTQYLNVGDVVLAKIGHVDETRRVNLTMKEQGLRKLSTGQIMKVVHTKVPRIIGKNGSMISLLKEHTGCRIFIGQNGTIWIDGELDGMRKASAAINIIDRGTHLHGLTDEVRAYLDGDSPGNDDERM